MLSDVRFEALPRTYLISIRRLGAYADLDAETREALWRELIDRAGRNGVLKSPVRMGFFPDDPGMTPPAMQRADLCIPVERPIESTDRVRCFRLAGGMHGVIEHVGAYSTAGQAYRNLADGIRASDRYIFRDAPPLQIFRQVHLGGDRSANHSEICFAVKRRSGAREGQETSRTAP